MADLKNQQKIEILLESREKTRAQLKKIQELFKKEKDNEDVWPGHASTFYQQTESEQGVLLAHLAAIEEELKALEYNESKN